MLAPDATTTQTILAGMQGAMKNIDQYVESIQSVHFPNLDYFSEILPMGKKSAADYQKMKTSVETVQTHAKQWKDSLSSTIRTTIFQNTSVFGTSFQAKSEQIIGLLGKEGGQDAIVSILKGLLATLNDQRSRIAGEKDKLAAFGRQMTADSNSLASDGALILDAIDDVRTWQAKLDGLAKRLPGASESLTHTAAIADAMVKGLNQLALKFTGWESLSGAAHTAIDNLATIWEGLQGHYEEVINDLPAGKISDLVLRGQLKAAQEAWQSLTLFIADETNMAAH